MSKATYLRKDDARKCPVHQAVIETAADELMEYGYFHKEDVIKSSGMFAVRAALRWDYISEFIKEDQDCELIPLSSSFWDMTSQERMDAPEKALAGGHGAKTCGYALVGIDNGALAVRKLYQKRNMANGTGKAFRNFADELVKRELLETEDQKLLGSVQN